MNGDEAVDNTDVDIWVKDLANTWLGDANVDGEFNSTDFVTVFVKGKYEREQDSVWSEGDWNGDGRFNSSDFVVAFVDGGYEKGKKPPAVGVVPEPSTGVLILLGLVTAMCCRHRRR